MSHFNFNGKLFAGNEPVIGPASRGLRYGDGLFETMKLTNGRLLLATEHFARLWKGMQLLQMSIPKLWSPEKFERQALQLAEKNGLANARIRLTAFRSEGGIFEAIEAPPNFILEATPLPQNAAALNTNGLQLCIYRDAVKTIDSFSNLKHNNCLPYVMGAIYAKQQQCNEALILNSRGNVCEGTIANLFIIKDGKIFTPALTEGCIAGVTRKYLIEKIRALGYGVSETVVTVENVMAADEVFLSNSISEMRWVKELEGKKMGNSLVQKISLEIAR